MSRHLLAIDDLGAEGICEILRLTDVMREIGERPIPKAPALRGRTVATAFFEDSTRTRLSFEAAAKRLSADTMTFSASSSSLNKGESLRDTVLTLAALGIHALVVRHRSSGAPARIAAWLDDEGHDISVVNAGDGWHQHPTQALLDCATLAGAWEVAATPTAFTGKRIVIVGDITHSRVARSDVHAFRALGAEVVLVAPPTLLPIGVEAWGASVAADLDDVVGEADAVYVLRIQRERMAAGLLTSLGEYTARYGLTVARAARMRPDAVVLHPGPMNRDVEIAPAVADGARSLVTTQVSEGVAVRTAVLFHLLAQEPVPFVEVTHG
jgi:aspartate carbamoyltransferase catalytic subunit